MKIKFSLKLNAIFARYEWMNIIKYLNLKCLLLSNGWIFFCFFQFISSAFVFFSPTRNPGLKAMLCSNEWIFYFYSQLFTTEKAEKLNAMELNYATA